MYVHLSSQCYPKLQVTNCCTTQLLCFSTLFSLVLAKIQDEMLRIDVGR